MILLALDTTLDRCSVALVTESGALAVLSEAMTRGHAERLAPMADEVMRKANAPFAAIDRVAVTTGPGSFTGLRVGLSFARALALALGKPCIGVSTLEALALEDGPAGARGAAIGAAGEFYVARYEDGAARAGPLRRRAAEAGTMLAGALVRGPAAAQFGGCVVSAPDIVALGLRALRLDPKVWRPDPLYLRAPHVTAPAP